MCAIAGGPLGSNASGLGRGRSGQTTGNAYIRGRPREGRRELTEKTGAGGGSRTRDLLITKRPPERTQGNSTAQGRTETQRGA